MKARAQRLAVLPCVVGAIAPFGSAVFPELVCGKIDAKVGE